MKKTLLGAILIVLYYFQIGRSLELQTIGIYSLCKGNHTQDEFSELPRAMELFIQKQPRLIFNHQSPVSLTNGNISGRTSYQSFDVCYDHEKITSLLVDILLNSTFYAINKKVIWRNTYTTLNYFLQQVAHNSFDQTFVARRSSMVTRIIAHLPPDMLQTLLNIMSIEKHIVVTVHNPSFKFESINNVVNLNIVNMESEYDDFIKLMKIKRWKNVLVLRNQTSEQPFSAGFKAIVEILKNMKDVCIKTYTVHSEDGLREKLDKEYADPNKTNNLIVIDVNTPYGIAVYNLNRSASYFKRIYDLDLFHRIKNYQPFMLQRQIMMLSHGSRSMVDWFSAKDYLNKFENNTALQEKAQEYYSALNLLFYSTKVMFTHHSHRTVLWSDLLVSIQMSFKGLFGDLLFNANLPNFNVLKDVHSECYHPVCQEGKEKKFGKFPKESTHWDEEIGYYCQLCKPNYIKPSIGEARCHPCPGYYISNIERTKCLDPFLTVHHKLTDKSGIAISAICMVGAVLCSFGLVLFITYRRTPIVRLSDFTMSLTHLLVILVYFCSTPILYFYQPTREMCMSRTMSIALLYNLNTSIVFTKSNKLLNAFSNKIRSTRYDVLKTQLTQGSMILVNILTAVLLILTSWSNQLPEIKERLETIKMQKFLSCSNGLDNIVLLSFMLILHLACFIQAFRCRKLPDHLNEAMNIVYASFIVTVALCVMYPIYFSQKVNGDGELVVVFVTMGNNFVLFLFMYAKQLITIVFKSEKNTKHYYRGKQAEAMRIQASNMKQLSIK